MSAHAVLNQDEIDALLHGVDNGAVKIEDAIAAGAVSHYDFTHPVRSVRGCMPALETINERLTRLFSAGLFSMLRRTPQVAVAPVRMQPFGEYLHSLSVPSSLNLIKVLPLRGTGLVVLDPKFVFAAVGNFFGGNGRFAKIEGREFTATETRVIHLLLKQLVTAMQAAWSPVARLDIEPLTGEGNLPVTNIVSSGEIVVITRLHVELDGGGGDVHITLPYAMLEPLHELRYATVVDDRGRNDEGWAMALREEIEDAEVELSTVLGRGRLTMQQLLNLQVGDILHCDFSGKATLFAADVPIFRGAFGASHGQQAVQIEERGVRFEPQLFDGPFAHKP